VAIGLSAKAAGAVNLGGDWVAELQGAALESVVNVNARFLLDIFNPN